MFVTPIFYSEQKLPKVAAAVLTKNPIFVLVRAYRATLLEASAPDWHALGWLAVISLAVFLLGHAWFYKLRKSFADLI
jgi:lipopolysaccharide transport system permease protein